MIWTIVDRIEDTVAIAIVGSRVIAAIECRILVRRVFCACTFGHTSRLILRRITEEEVVFFGVVDAGISPSSMC